MRDQHSNGGAVETGGGLRELLRTNGRQVQGVRAHANGRFVRRCAAYRRMLRQS